MKTDTTNPAQPVDLPRLVLLPRRNKSMITITKSATADTRTCDFANTDKLTLLASSRTHIGDVVKAMAFFIGKLTEAAGEHDYDKLTGIDWFHKDFVTGFKETGWWDNHRKIHRHHLAQDDGIPADVNLLDVIEYIADCVMAGMARSGSVHALAMPPELLARAFNNTVELLKAEVVVSKENEPAQQRAANDAPSTEDATGALAAAPLFGVDELRADRDIEKKLRKDAEHALRDASELLEDIMRGKVNPEDESEKWLRTYDPIRLNRRADETPNGKDDPR